MKEALTVCLVICIVVGIMGLAAYKAFYSHQVFTMGQVGNEAQTEAVC